MTNVSIPVPCGKCADCTSRRASAWSFRLMQEDKISTSSHFVTLTYNTEHVPLTHNTFMTLDKNDLQKYFKRLRHLAPNLKYYAVGEYGGIGKRPHYHVILFNVDNKLDIVRAWALDGKPLGDVHLGDVNGASVGYTLKYISKPAWKPMHRNDDRLAQFSVMSKGLGANYLTPEMVKWHHAALTDRAYVNVGDGKKAAMPRFYKERLYTRSQMLAIAAAGQKRADQELEKPNTPTRTEQLQSLAQRNAKRDKKAKEPLTL